MRRINVVDLPPKVLMLNLYLTQGILLLIALTGIAFFQPGPLLESVISLFYTSEWETDVIVGCIAGAAIVAIELLVYQFLPKSYLDDGGINEKLFSAASPIQIILMTVTVAVVEELLFRGFLQHLVGLFWASLIFALIHFRYLRHWFQISFVFFISLAIGLIYEFSYSLIAPVTSHFVIDAVLGLMIRFNWLVTEAGNGENEVELEKKNDEGEQGNE